MKRRPGAMLLQRAGISLVLGVVTTFGVAWFAVLRPWNSGWRGGMSMSGVSWWIKDRWGETSYQFKAMMPQSPLTVEMMDNAIAAAWEDPGFEAAARDCRADLERMSPELVASWTRRRAGWPFYCIQFAETTDTAGTTRHEQLISLGASTEAQRAAGADDRRVPTGPMWMGLAGNIGVYSAAWFAAIGLLPIARAWRGTRRKRHGRCERCGYDMRGSNTVCPECGANPSDDSPGDANRSRAQGT